ncbi:hypothetical protein LF1_34210 [Rubripirellula obstinata]|uniref:DUF937 domain-containing protein n=1 Tax=Rubripirellula obstinata TaxID=406547 RepID=A0A5B1CM69_9BACT|nr:DUF937 domain-containing protein [Rubripirellula obstinata]KAA1260879.1 hypothetical protein LF1_34210 [Rubripirellula obstinata]
MSMNMMEILKGQLGGMVAGQLGKAVGLDSKQAESGIGALLPVILGGLMKQSSTPEGANQLDETLSGDDFDGGMFDNISDMFSGGGDTSSMSNMGGGLVKMIFGDKIGAIADIVGKVTGMKSSSTTSLLALLAPLVMSFLGKQKRSLGLDGGGMANLLMSQKDEVAKAMPGGMVGALGLTDLGFQDTPAGAPAQTPAAQPQVSSGGGGGGGVLGKLLIPLVFLGVLGFLGWSMLGKKAPEMNVPDVNVPDVDLGAATDALGMSADDVTGNLQEVFGGYKETLSGITDADSAQAAVPDMEKLNDQLGGISGLMDKLPAGIKDTVTGQLGSMIEPIKAMLEKVMAIPGVEPILKPYVESMLDKVDMLSA